MPFMIREIFISEWTLSLNNSYLLTENRNFTPEICAYYKKGLKIMHFSVSFYKFKGLIMSVQGVSIPSSHKYGKKRNICIFQNFMTYLWEAVSCKNNHNVHNRSSPVTWPMELLSYSNYRHWCSKGQGWWVVTFWGSSRKSLNEFFGIGIQLETNLFKKEHLCPFCLKRMVSNRPCPFGSR